MGVKLERLRQNCFSFPPLNLPLLFFFFFFPPALRTTLDLIGLGALAQRRRANTEAAHFFITDRLAA